MYIVACLQDPAGSYIVAHKTSPRDLDLFPTAQLCRIINFIRVSWPNRVVSLGAEAAGD